MDRDLRMPSHVKMLLASIFLLNASKYSTFSFLAVYLVESASFAPWQVGTILSTSLILSNAAPLLLGAFTERMGYRQAVASGCLLATVGYFIPMGSASFAGLEAASLFIGLGAALYDPAARSALGQLEEGLRQKAFTLYNQALNGGLILGAGLGGLLLAYVSDTPPFYMGAILTLLLFLVYVFVSVPFPPPTAETASMAPSLQRVLRNRKFLIFCLILTFFWILFAQLTVAFPLYLYQITANNRWSSLILLGNGAFGFLLMFIIRPIFNHCRPIRLIQFGLFLLALGLGCAFWFPSLVWVLVCVLIFTAGETIALPSMDLAVAEFSRTQDTAVYFGMLTLFNALGGTLGNYLGTWALKHFPNAVWPWIIFGLTGVIGILALSWRPLTDHPDLAQQKSR